MSRISLLGVCGRPDGFDDLIQGVESLFQAFQDVGSFFGLPEIINRPPDMNLPPVLDKQNEHLLEIEHLGPAFDNGQKMIPKETSIWVYL